MKKNKNKKRVLVGLTGGFGTGKTTVTGMFRQEGARIISSDKLVQQALKRGTQTYQKISHLFAKDSILKNGGHIDKKKLATIVFSNGAKRKKLESIIHPFVFREIKRLSEKGSKVFVVEVPLLFETKFDQKMDWTVVVTASPKIQLARLKKKLGLTPSQSKARIKAQWSLTRKKKLANFVINNNGNLSETKKQVKKIWKTISHN